MTEETIQLLKVRLIAFLWESLSLILTVVAGTLTSEHFRLLVMEHFGEGLIGSVVLLTVAGVVKHLRNLKLVNDVQLGSKSEADNFLI